MFVARTSDALGLVRKWNSSHAAIVLSGVLLIFLATGCSSAPSEDLASPAAKAELTNLYQVGPVVDLLAMVEPKRDAVRGEFLLVDDALIIPAVRAAQLNLSVDLPEQYQLMLDVAKVRGKESLNLGITVGGRQTMAVIEGWGQKISGLNRVDGQLGENNVTSSRFPVFEDDRTKSIRIIVRKESVLVDVDGGVFIDYRGSPSRLDFDGRFFQRPARNQLLLGGWETEFRVTAWTLTPLGETRVPYAKQPPRIVAQNDRPPIGSGDAATRATSGPSSTALFAGRQGSNSKSAPEADSSEDNSASQPDTTASAPGLKPKGTTVASSKATPTETRTDANPLAPWEAIRDPYPGWDGAAQRDISISLGEGWAVAAQGPSPYFMIGENKHNSIRWSVYDVRTGQAVGQPCELPHGEQTQTTLCPSGRYLKSYVGVAAARRVVVHSFADGRQVYSAESSGAQHGLDERDLLALNHVLLQVRLDRDRVKFQRVDLRTGNVEAEWIGGRPSRDLKAVAISSGGRYALANWNNTFAAYQLSDGKLVGEVRGPEGLEFNEAIAFSLDGAEAALLGFHDDRRSPSFWSLDWASGETRLLANVEAEIHGLENTYKLGPALAWFPDNELLLYYGRDVLDRTTGRFVYQIPENLYWQNARRPLSSRSILAMMPGKDTEHREYRSVPFNTKALDDALRVIRNGGIAEDIGLPPLTVGGAETGRAILSAENATQARLKATPRAEISGPLKLPFQLGKFNDPAAKLQRIEFADPPEPIAIAHFTLRSEDEDERSDVIVRYDIRRGKSTGFVPIRHDLRLVNVSSDGKRVLVGLFNEVDAFRRLDVVDLVSKDHVAGWRPFAQEKYAEDKSHSGQLESRNPQTVSWARFVDSQRVLTVNPLGKLVCWQIPECRVLWTCDDFGKPFSLSSDRRYLAGANGAHIHILDVTTGTWVGKLEADVTPRKVLRAGFSPDTSRLAAVLRYQGRHSLIVWDLARGEKVEQFELPYSTVSPPWSHYKHPLHRRPGLKFRDDGLITLDDLYLIDIVRRTVPWQYEIRRGKHAVNDLDSREWFTELKTGSNEKGQTFEFWLEALKFPSSEAISHLKNAPLGAPHPIGRSSLSLDGETIRLETNASGGH